MPGSVHVIILNWRTADMTLRATQAAITAMEGIDGVISVIDNDSGDGSFETLQAEAGLNGWTENGRLRVLQSGHNGGFGAGNNAAMAVPLTPPADHVLILNSDSFATPDMIRLMRDYLDQHPRVGMVGSRVIGEDGAHHSTHFRFPSISSEIEDAARTGPISRMLRHKIVAMPMPPTAGPVDWVAGASLMIRQQVLDDIGGFDEAFFLYYEETDLCRRAGSAGWPTHYLPQAVVTHVGSVSTGMKEWALPPGYWFESREHYFRKQHGRAYALTATAAHLVGLAIRRLRGLTDRDDHDFPHGMAGQLFRHAFRSGQPRRVARMPSANRPTPAGEQI